MIKKVQEILTSQSADFNSEFIDIELFKMFSVEVNVTNGSSYAGTVAIEVCNDYDKGGWVEVTDTSLALTGATDIQLYDVVDSAVSYVRLKFVVTTGSADFEIDWTIKG